MQKKCCFRLSFSLHSETASHPSPSNVLHVVPVGQPTCQHQAAHDSRCAHCVAHLRKIGIWRTHARRPFHLCALLVQVAARIRSGMAGPTELCNFWYGVVARRIRRHGRKRAATQEKRHIFHGPPYLTSPPVKNFGLEVYPWPHCTRCGQRGSNLEPNNFCSPFVCFVVVRRAAFSPRRSGRRTQTHRRYP